MEHETTPTLYIVPESEHKTSLILLDGRNQTKDRTSCERLSIGEIQKVLELSLKTKNIGLHE